VYESGVGAVVNALAGQLQEAIDTGRARPVDTRRMAERFYSALSGVVPRRALAGLGHYPPKYQQHYLEETVDMFVEALTPKRKIA
jgi:hypothetical protein